MAYLLFDLIFWGIFVCGGTLFVLFAFIMAIRQYKQDIAKQNKVEGNEDYALLTPEHTTVKIKATVVDQTCYIKTTGIRIQKIIKEFVVVFQTDNGNILKLNVPEEMYDGFEQNQRGILSVIDGKLYGFELEEADSMP